MISNKIPFFPISFKAAHRGLKLCLISKMEKTTNINKNKYLYTRERKLPLFSENSRNKGTNKEKLVIKGKNYQKGSERFWTKHQPLISKTISSVLRNMSQSTTMTSGPEHHKSTKSLRMNSRSGKSTPFRSSHQLSSMQKKREFKQEQALKSLNFWSPLRRNVDLRMKEPIKPSLMRWHKPQNRQSLVLPMQRSWIMKQKTTVPKHLDYLQVLDTWNKRMEENRTSLIVSSSRNYMKQDS